MIRISGPVSLGAITLSNGVKLLLLGDEHASRKGICQKCKRQKNCYYVTDFLDKVQEPTELFLESMWQASTDIQEPLEPVDVLSDVVSKYYRQIFYHKGRLERKTGVVRAHYGDLRSEANLFELLKVVLHYWEKQDYGVSNVPLDLSLLIKYFPTVKHFKQFVDALVLSDNVSKSMTKIFKGNKEVAQKFISEKYSAPKAKAHKVYKQVSKIKNKVWKKALLKYYDNKCKELVKIYKPYKQALERLQKNQISQEDEDTVFMTILLWLALVTDMYTLARMLYYIEKGDTKLFMTYTGSYHTHEYMNFFLNYLPASQLNYYQDKKTRGTQTVRCVSVPASFVHIA